MLIAVWLSTVPPSAQTAGAIAGQVVADPGTFPVPPARVLVADTTRETLTDADGCFVLSDVAAGERTVIVVRDGYAPLSQSVAVTAGQTITLDIRLPFAPTLSQEWSSLVA